MFGPEEDWEYTKQHDLTDKELEEYLQYLREHPLFIKDIPEDISQNPNLEALQNLAFSDSPENIAKNCNERGNAIYKKGSDTLYYMREALKCYEDGIEAGGKDVEVNAKLFCNRALINFKLRNYGKVLEDCKKIISFKPDYIKAYFRAASAYFFLRKYEEALSFCEKGLKFEPKNIELLSLSSEVIKQLEKIKKTEDEKKKVVDSSNNKLIEGCKQRNILLGVSNLEIPESYKELIHIDSSNILHIPILIYYPEFNQTDFIQNSSENDILKDHFTEIFNDPLPWDQFGFYKNWQDLKYFIQIKSSNPLYQLKVHNLKQYDEIGFKNVKLGETIRDVLKIEGHVIPKILEIYVISERSPFYNIFVSGNKIYSR